MNATTRLSYTSLALAAFLFAGCGSSEKLPELLPVQGTVTVDGKPADGLTVRFDPEGEGDANLGLSTATTDEQGKYVLTYKGQYSGAPEGRYRVRIQHGDPAEVDESELLPAQYNDETDLTAEVTPTQTEHNFDLETTGR